MNRISDFGWKTVCSFLRPIASLQISLFAIFLLLAPPDTQSQCNNTTVLTLTGPGTDTWTAPATGGPFSVRITATGGGGGNSTAFPLLNGGSGATMAGTFTVQNGEVIRAIAGGPGGDGTNIGGGGGSGSGAVNCGTSGNCSPGGVILIIAAGGNGQDGPGDDGLGGSELTNGNGSGGSAGSNDQGGGGGGQSSSGGSATGLGQGFGGAAVNKSGLANGGVGSGENNAPPVDNSGGDGMGGGGGGGDVGPGGGGGHTGAPGNNGDAATSFNSGAAQSNAPGATGGGPNLGTVLIVCLESLPVKLINFQALIQKNGTVELLWSTATEQNNRGYDVEHSADNRNWSSLGFVPGHGTTSSRHDYRFADENPLRGVNYYRLKQMDTDGKYEYSPMVVADVRTSGPQFDVFPNPSFSGEFSLRAISKQEGEALLEIFSWAGHKVYHETIRVYEGTIVTPLNMTTFPKGTYTARLKMPDGQVVFKKMLLQ